MPKPETSPNAEARNEPLAAGICPAIRHSDFGFLSDFGIRISDFIIISPA